MINSGNLLINKQDIQHLQGHNFLCFTPNFQNQVITYLEIHRKQIHTAFSMYSRKVHLGERNIYWKKNTPKQAPILRYREMILNTHQHKPFACNKKKHYQHQNSRYDPNSESIHHPLHLTTQSKQNFSPAFPNKDKIRKCWVPSIWLLWLQTAGCKFNIPWTGDTFRDWYELLWKWQFSFL